METNNFLHNIFYDAGMHPVIRKAKKSDNPISPLFDLLKDHNSKVAHDFVDVCNVEALMESGACTEVENALVRSSDIGRLPVRLEN